MTTRDEYIFRNVSPAPELTRLRVLESVFDEKTRQWILAAGPLAGRRCLEVGAGAGSIAAWMGSQVGPTGRVVAVDTNVQFLRGLGAEVEVLEGDVATAALPAESFDLIHARYVLIHNADARGLLSAVLRALRRGGTIVLEEPDFSAAAALAGPAELKQAFENVRRAMCAMFASRGLNYDFGRGLPGLIQETLGAPSAVEYDGSAQRGGSALAEMMRMSTLALEDKYVATGCATAADVASYARFAASPDCWGVYYATVRVRAGGHA